MKIYDFLQETNVIITNGSLYSGKEIPEKLLYVVHFEKNNVKGNLLLSSKNQIIYYINFGIDVYAKSEIKIEKEIKTITIKKIIEIIKRA